MKRLATRARSARRATNVRKATASFSAVVRAKRRPVKAWTSANHVVVTRATGRKGRSQHLAITATRMPTYSVSSAPRAHTRSMARTPVRTAKLVRHAHNGKAHAIMITARPGAHLMPLLFAASLDIANHVLMDMISSRSRTPRAKISASTRQPP